MIYAHRIFVSVILIWQIKQKSLEIFGYPLLDTSLIYISCTHARYVTSSTDEDKTDFQELFYSFCDFLCFVFYSVDGLDMVCYIISTCSCWCEISFLRSFWRLSKENKKSNIYLARQIFWERDLRQKLKFDQRSQLHTFVIVQMSRGCILLWFI